MQLIYLTRGEVMQWLGNGSSPAWIHLPPNENGGTMTAFADVRFTPESGHSAPVG
jgi:hypothetical protein